VKTLTIKVSEDLLAEIAGDAAARNVSRSQVIRERLTRQPAAARRRKASLWSRMEDLVITEDSLPRDLSSNKSHLKNYGRNRAD
jgi:hypothetical protein